MAAEPEETMAKSKSGPVYQLKITLADLKPPVWRRVEATTASALRFAVFFQGSGACEAS